ncbi:MAG: DUF1629 domain-containing protein [Pseudomonadota bacterium]
MAYSALSGIRPQDEDAEYSSYFEWLDGDWKKIDIYDASQDGGTVVTRFNSGRRMKPDFMPTKIKRVDPNSPRTPMLDVERFPSCFLVCKEFKDIVEEFEPGVHQFFPMEIFESGDKIADYYLFNICTRLDTLHPELTFPRDDRGFLRPVKGKPFARVFATAAIGDHHIYVDKFLGGTLMSNAIGERLKQANLTGLKLSGPLKEA